MLTSSSSRPSVVRFSPNVPRAELELWSLARPELVVLGRVGVDGLVPAAVHPQVGLAVAGEVERGDRDSTAHRLLVDPRPDRLASPPHLGRKADVDGEHPHRVPAVPTDCAAVRPSTVSAWKRLMCAAISSSESSTAKCPLSSMCSSASGRSRRYARPPSGVKKMSFSPQRISVCGRRSRRKACHRGYSSTLVR